MLFIQYIRPDSNMAIVDLPASPYIEMLHNKLIDNKVEFGIEHVPQFGQFFFFAQLPLYDNKTHCKIQILDITPDRVTESRYEQFLNKVLKAMMSLDLI